MKKIQIIIIGLLVCLITTPTCAQLAMGKWRTHFAYNNVSQIAQSETKIFAVSEGALFSINKQDEDGGMEFYSKINGLNGENIKRIEYDTNNKQLLIIYANGNIDILASGGVTNIPDFLNKQMSSSKDVNQIQFYDNKAYLACNFGIVVLNMQKKEIADTYYIGSNASEIQVLNTTIHNGEIYAVSPTTLYKASITNKNLVNYESWSTVAGLPGSGNLQSAISFAGKLFILRSGKIYKQESDYSWTNFRDDLLVTDLNVSNGSLNVFTSTTTYLFNNLLVAKTTSGTGQLSDAEYDTTNSTYWFAANTQGIISYKQIGSEKPTINTYKPKGPALNYPFEMRFAGKKLFVVPGGRWSTQDMRDGIVMIYENETWTNIYRQDIQSKTNEEVLDFMNIAIDPLDDKHFFATSYGTGLYEFKNNIYFKWHNYLNSKIETILTTNYFNSMHYMRLDGAAFDKKGNLIMANMSVTAPIKILLANGQWTELTYTDAAKPTLGRILISNINENQKWIPSVRYSPGILIFDDNGTLTDQKDDKSVFFSKFTYADTDNNGHATFTTVSPTNVYTMAQDKNGVVWVGTEQGPFLFQNPAKAFEANFSCSRVKISRNDGTNLADYLLKDEKIKAIAIDGANRKWIGTESSGVYLMSENGQETIQHFTTSNSALLANDILSIAINPISGEVFFGTGQGIISYQSDASLSEDTFGDVHAYPNPVRENYTGVITITGLIDKTQVKITDITGNLVCETVSNGSIATWNGKDIRGRKVNTGVYLAVCVNEDGTQSTITKIMVIN